MYKSKEQHTKARPGDWKGYEDMRFYDQAKQMDLGKIPYQGLEHPKFRQKGHLERVGTIGRRTASSTMHMESSSCTAPGNSNWKPFTTTAAMVLEGQCAPKVMAIGGGEEKIALGTSVHGSYEETMEHAGVKKGQGGDLAEEPDIGWILELLE